MKYGKLNIHQHVGWDELGTALGYKNATINILRELDESFDLEYGGKEGEVNLSFAPPIGFKPIPNSINWLFTTVENRQLNELAVQNLKKAQGIVVPSPWCRQVIHEAGVVSSPIHVIRHGVDPVYGFVKRKLPPTKYHQFRFLYVGALSPRKGVDQLLWMWDKTKFREQFNLELYLKVSVDRGDRHFNRVVTVDNVIMDGKYIEPEKLCKLYHSAHCFVLPTRGEAFALTLAEAMRTGLPCIASDWSGHTSYFDEEVGYPVETFEVESSPQLLCNWFTKEEPKEGEEKIPLRTPRADSLFKAMLHVGQNYEEALEKARRGSERMCEEYRWKDVRQLLTNLFLSYHSRLWEGEYGVNYTARCRERAADNRP